MSCSALRVYLIALSSYHEKMEGYLVFSHMDMKLFLWGLLHVFPPTKELVPVWDLPLVLNKLMGKPFEPMASCSFQLLAWKTAFLAAITSAKWVSELVALRLDSPYLNIHEMEVSLVSDISFLPKVVSEFHLQLEVHPPTFFLNPQTEEDWPIPWMLREPCCFTCIVWSQNTRTLISSLPMLGRIKGVEYLPRNCQTG